MNNHDSIIGIHVKIEYDDQNDRFASILPRYGTIIRQIKAKNEVDDWFLIKLNNPFEHSYKKSDDFLLTTLHCKNILIRSRWKEYKIGGTKPTSVFILLILDEALLNTEPINVEDFYHVAWGMCHTIQT